MTFQQITAIPYLEEYTGKNVVGWPGISDTPSRRSLTLNESGVKYTNNRASGYTNSGLITAYNDFENTKGSVFTLEPGGIYTQYGGYFLNSGTINLNTNAPASNSPGVMTIFGDGKKASDTGVNNGTINIEGPCPAAGQNLLFNGIDGWTFTNNNSINNGGRIITRQCEFINNAFITQNSDASIEIRIPQDGGKFTNNGTVTGGSIIGGGAIQDYGTFAPGNSAGGMLIDSDYHKLGGSKEIELGGALSTDLIDTQYDFFSITGDLIIGDNVKLDVSLIDGFELELAQEFIIAHVDGELIGEYEGLSEGSLVGMFDSIYGSNFEQGLFITYEGGDGNDIALYTQDSFF